MRKRKIALPFVIPFLISHFSYANDFSEHTLSAETCSLPFHFQRPKQIPRDQRLVTEDYREAIFLHSVARSVIPRELLDIVFLNSGGSVSGRDLSGNARSYLYLRDISPVQIQTGDGQIRLISYFNLRSETSEPYLGTHPQEDYHSIRETEFNGIPEKNRCFGDHHKSDPSERKWMEVRTLPLLADGGNLVLTGDHLITTDQLIQENSLARDMLIEKALKAFPVGSLHDIGIKLRQGLEKIQYRPRNREEILQILSRYFEIPLSSIIILPWMPGETTGHADIFIGAPRRGIVVVPFVPDYFLNLIPPFEKEKMEEVNRWLDNQVSTLETRGLRVFRIPMQPSFEYRPSTVSGLGYDFKFATPVGWVIQKDTIYVPYAPLVPKTPLSKAINPEGEIFDLYHWRAHVGQTSDETIERMQNETRKILSGLGFKVVFVPFTKTSEEILKGGGSYHCATGQLAFP